MKKRLSNIYLNKREFDNGMQIGQYPSKTINQLNGDKKIKVGYNSVLATELARYLVKRRNLKVNNYHQSQSERNRQIITGNTDLEDSQGHKANRASFSYVNSLGNDKLDDLTKHIKGLKIDDSLEIGKQFDKDDAYNKKIKHADSLDQKSADTFKHFANTDYQHRSQNTVLNHKQVSKYLKNLVSRENQLATTDSNGNIIKDARPYTNNRTSISAKTINNLYKGTHRLALDSKINHSNYKNIQRRIKSFNKNHNATVDKLQSVATALNNKSRLDDLSSMALNKETKLGQFAKNAYNNPNLKLHASDLNQTISPHAKQVLQYSRSGRQHNFERKNQSMKLDKKILSKSPYYRPNHLKDTLKGSLDDYVNGKKELKQDKRVLKAGYNPISKNEISMAGRHLNMSESYKGLKTDLKRLKPIYNQYHNTKLGKSIIKNNDPSFADISDQYNLTKDEQKTAQGHIIPNKHHVKTAKGFKKELTKQLNGLQKLTTNHSFNQSKAFAKYPIALKALNISNQKYYKGVHNFQTANKPGVETGIHYEKIPKGLYPISSEVHSANQDRITPTELSSRINHFKNNELKEYGDKDLKYIVHHNVQHERDTASLNFVKSLGMKSPSDNHPTPQKSTEKLNPQTQNVNKKEKRTKQLSHKQKMTMKAKNRGIQR